MKDVLPVGDKYAAILGISKVKDKDTGKLIDQVRRNLPEGVFLQAVRSDAVYGIDHIINALKISFESEKRKILLAAKIEIDLLLRIACVDQISIALIEIGLVYYEPACLILFSAQKRNLESAADNIRQTLSDSDNSFLLPSSTKRELISKRLGLDSNGYLSNDATFIDLLAEKAALLNR